VCGTCLEVRDYASFGSDSEVVCFEPEPDCCERIHQTAQANPELEISVEQVFVGSGRGTLAFDEYPI
jgi:FkbM family methyltransferase